MRVCPQCKLKYTNDQERCFVDGATLEDVPDPHIGQVIAGRYLIEEILGEGGMATVYRARHTLVHKPVAVKVMHAEMARDPALRERFKREAKNAAALAHPNIVEIFDEGETDDGSLFLVMELLEGAPLTHHMARGPMDPAHVARFGLQIARGLARAHDFDVVHRDLKPDNVFVSRGPEGQPPVLKLLDFGIARSMHDERLTKAGQIFGTPQYMAPEQVTSIDAGPPADLYALGCILFEMLTGRLPFLSEEVTGFLLKHMQEPPPRPSDLAPQCPRRLEELILALLAKKPEDRPVDAHQVIKELAALVPEGDVVSAPPAAVPARQSAPPTLPPTTLERWGRRTAIFDQMLGRAFGGAHAPPELADLLGEIREALERIHGLRSAGLKEQRKIDAAESAAKEARARLGFAVQSLAEDLSQARESARAARGEVTPYFTAEDQARASYGRSLDRLREAGGYREMTEPEPQLVRAIRELADAVDRWQLAHDAAAKARKWVDAKEGEVRDLDYQVKMLRQNLERSEEGFQATRDAAEAVLVDMEKQAVVVEQSLVGLATRFCDALRPRQELGDLFDKLEREGAA